MTKKDMLLLLAGEPLPITPLVKKSCAKDMTGTLAHEFAP